MEKSSYRQTAKVYDIVHGKNHQPMPDSPFYREYARQLCGEKGEKGEILELGCGTGRVALDLAREGFRVTGLDLSQQMLDIFAKKLADENEGVSERVQLVHGSMAEFSFGKKFALIIAPFRAFQAVTAQADIENTLACVRKHLTDDGIFIINAFKPNKDPMDEGWCSEETLNGEITDEETGIHIELYDCRERIDTENQIIYPYLAYVAKYPDGSTERLVEPLQLKYYYSPQLRAEVEKSGLVIIEEFSWYDKLPLDDSGSEIIFVCKR
jgi:SAM-dependent methyltransferase